jgi:glycosyltransferase involved in cell wall biosynthesis
MARILMIAYTTYVHDGRVKRHAQALAERGDQVDLLCLENPHQGLHCGVNVIGLKVRRYRGNSKTSYFRAYVGFFLAAGARALKLALRRRYDVVIVCTMPDAAVLCAVPLKLLGSKIVLDIHDTMPELYREKFGGRRGAIGARLLAFEELASTWFAHRVLAVHELHRARLEEAGVRHDKIAVVLNSPDPRIFRSNRNRHVPQEDFTVLCHGTIAERLGLDVAIQAIALLRDRAPNIRLLIVGSGDYLSECRALAMRLDLDDRIRFEPARPLEQLPQLLNCAAIGLIPNRASSATHLMLPVKLLEYAKLGIPVVAARLKTIEHYFDESAVRYFEPGDPVALAAALEDLYRSPASREALARNARAIMQRLDWAQQREHYLAAVDSLLADQSGRGGVHSNGAAKSRLAL